MTAITASEARFDPNEWEDYVSRQTQDRKTLKRINLLIAYVSRDSFSGIGKPEPAPHRLGRMVTADR